MRMEKYFQNFCLTLLVIHSGACDTNFMGDSGSSGEPTFRGGDSQGKQPEGGDPGGGTGGNNGDYPGGTNGTQNNLGNNDGNGTGLGGINGTGGVDTRDYLPAQIKVLRRDKSPVHSFDQSDVQLKYKVLGSNTQEQGVIPAESQNFTIPRACPKSGNVSVRLSFMDTGVEYLPNKNTSVGGPIGYRLNNVSLLVSYERDAVGQSDQIAYHNNDDLVIQITCPAQTSRLDIPDLCFDQRIPDNGADLYTDNVTTAGDKFPGGGPARLCNGT